MNAWVKLAALAVAAFVVAQVLMREQAPEVAAEGRPAPAIALPALDGRTVDLAALRGRVVVLNFWATWCPPCRDELPELGAAWREGSPRCLEVVGVTGESAREDVQAAVQRFAIPYPVVVDADGEVGRRYGLTAYPRTYLVDAGGVVRKVFTGTVTRRALLEAAAPLLPATCPRGAP
jgi:cytochrome c biogenesis protein CcmG/thiol:disulfide interchange protein DsbE